MPNKVAIIGAMDCEINKIKDVCNDIQIQEANNLTIYTGTLYGHPAVIAKCGVGKVNAALNTQYIIDKFIPEIIINTGVAGGIGENLSIGDVVIGESLIQHDFNVTALGYTRGNICNRLIPDKPTVFHSDKKLVGLLENLLKNNSKSINFHTGRIATGDIFIGTTEMKKKIAAEFGAVAAEMEGCAIAQTANLNNIPCLIIRAISDLADGTATKSQSEFEEMTSKISSEAVEILLKNL